MSKNMNMAYLQSNRTKAGDECYTPFYAVAPLLEFIPKNKRIWCPFDEDWSAYYQTFAENGYEVVRSSLYENQNFFNYEPPPDSYDVIISNPPYSMKDKVLKRLYELGKPFALLLPVTALQAKGRFRLFRNGLELLVFDARIDYHTWGDFESPNKGIHFGSMYFCRDFLPEKLIFRELQKYQRALKQGGGA